MSKNKIWAIIIPMHWIRQYDIIFFDLDGLLVNTEHLHFEAYRTMCLGRGFVLPWDFKKYCSIAHASAEGLSQEIYVTLPALHKKEPNWAILYAEKKEAYRQILSSGSLELMPGVEEVLVLLETHGIPSCVVTNSFKEQTDKISEKIPLLKKIPFWVTREDYQRPKPSADPYLAAKLKYARPQDKILGFEDTVRGWKALDAAHIEGIVISSCLSSEFENTLKTLGASQFSSFEDLLDLS